MPPNEQPREPQRPDAPSLPAKPHGRRHTPAEWRIIHRKNAEYLRELVAWVGECEDLAREERKYRRLFRPGRGHRVGRSPPCLQCALKGLHCSATYVRYQDDVRCQRCERNGEAFCVRQRQDLTRGEVVDPDWLRRGGLAAAAEEEEDEEEGGARAGRGRMIDPFGVAAGDGGEVWQVECMVFCLDPALRRDRRRLLDLAADMLHLDDAKYVHGTRVSPMHARNFALPMWHANDKPGNRGDPEYLMRLPADYFREARARWEENREEITMKMEKKRAEYARQAEKRRIEEAEKAEKAEQKRIKDEKSKVRTFYMKRDRENGCDMTKKRAERTRIFNQQMALGKPFLEVVQYMDALMDKYIEEIKSGLRTELPF